MRDNRYLRRILILIMVFCMVFSVYGNLSANSLMAPQFFAEFVNTADDSKYYVILLGKSNDGSESHLSASSSNHTEEHRDLLTEYVFREAELGEPGYVTDGVDTFLAQCDCLDGFVYDDDMTGVECCFGDSYIMFTYVAFVKNYDFRFLFYWPDSGEYKLSETFSLERINQIRVDMSEDAPYYSITDLEYAYELNALLPGVAFHLAITLIIEILVALFFKLRTKKLLLTILITNIITNVSANLVAILSVRDYIQLYLFIELAVFIVEFIIYRIAFTKDVKTGRIAVFTAVANLMSAIGGFFAFLAVLNIVGIT